MDSNPFDNLLFQDRVFDAVVKDYIELYDKHQGIHSHCEVSYTCVTNIVEKAKNFTLAFPLTRYKLEKWNNIRIKLKQEYDLFHLHREDWLKDMDCWLHNQVRHIEKIVLYGYDLKKDIFVSHPIITIDSPYKPFSGYFTNEMKKLDGLIFVGCYCKYIPNYPSILLQQNPLVRELAVQPFTTDAFDLKWWNVVKIGLKKHAEFIELENHYTIYHAHITHVSKELLNEEIIEVIYTILSYIFRCCVRSKLDFDSYKSRINCDMRRMYKLLQMEFQEVTTLSQKFVDEINRILEIAGVDPFVTVDYSSDNFWEYFCDYVHIHLTNMIPKIYNHRIAQNVFHDKLMNMITTMK